MSSVSAVLYKKNLGVSGPVRKRFGKEADAMAVRGKVWADAMAEAEAVYQKTIDDALAAYGNAEAWAEAWAEAGARVGDGTGAEPDA